MHHSLYTYNEANNNTVNNNGIESIYATLTANQLPLRDVVPSTPCSAVSATVDPAMAMGSRLSADVATLVDRAMSIDEHLQSMPMPLTGWNDHQFRSQDEIDMLSMGSAGRAVLHGPPLPCQLRNVIVSRCDGGVASSSDTSSSSCSPSSAENLHQQQQRQHQQPLKNNDASLDSTVASILNHSLKPEPSDADFPVDGTNGSATAAQHRLPMQPMSLHLAAGYGGRCSNDSAASGAMSTASSSNTPTPVRRSRSNHDGMLKCQFCPKKWADQAALHTHMADCRMMRGHECAQCGKRFKARGGLQQHLRIHSNDRPYACHFCAKRFTQKSHVDQHERIHTGAKPFTCQFCGRAFRQRSQQLGHEATHSNSMNNNGGQMTATPSTQQHSASTAPSPLPQQSQRELLRNEFQTPGGLIQELQSPSSTSSSSFSSGNQLNLLALSQVTPSSCTNSAVSSLLALSNSSSSSGQNPPTTPTSPPSSSQHPFNTATSQLHQAAVGLLNGLH